MLKPRKCRKLLLIISPQLKAAKGKKLYAINGKWAGDEFVKYVNASPSMRPQFGMVGRKLGTIYRRHMEKFFSGDRKVDWTKLHGVPETELPQRQTGQKALAEILSGTRIDFNYHHHIPDTTQKHYFATIEAQTK
ncbi:hypothetical protein BIZ78_gp137 [Erwinia phage vB_EamM_Caitlin]|uniref:hypothetical protein n=1 Tax=Erwinia phage vB_EamM_Caitlin TaxID=1883379 RepID=UPI00081CCBDB|nr:hypothetical protein BIZ78_gp137 [Erwinia phage vB_EamM_Caitlin]ANZ48438.1 hypothetical protein CAITLIN_143 [Erwinia phage vB_EamM_Caitlin]